MLMFRRHADDKNPEGMDAFDAAERGEVHVLAHLIQESPFMLHARGAWKRTPLHWAALTGQPSCIKLLVESGANIDALDDGDWTPLHWAASVGNKKAVKMLLELGANPDARDPRNRTPFDLAKKDSIRYLFLGVSRLESTMARDMKRLMTQDGDGSHDLVLIVEGRRVFAHKDILMARSSHFAALLGNGMRESALQEIELHDIEYQPFMTVLEYIYTDEFHNPKDIEVLHDILILADRFCLEHMKDLCSKYFEEGVTVEDFEKLYLIAHDFHLSSLKKTCWKFAAEHASELKKAIKRLPKVFQDELRFK